MAQMQFTFCHNL